MRRENVVLLFCAFGFLGLIAEVRYEHRDAVQSVRAAWIPIGYSALGALASLMAMARPGFARTVAQYILALGIGVSIAGVYLHTGGNVDKFRPYAQVWQAEGNKVGGSWPPPTPPLAIAGLSLIALAASWNGKRNR